MSFKFLTKDKISRLPKTTGVYVFKRGREFLYIGKGANIRERVKNHFQQRAFRDNLFINQVSKVGFVKTESEIEALILEAQLIKKYKPKYNVLWRDDKNYFYLAKTNEEFPRIFWTHQPKENAQHLGPFVDGKALKTTLKILRKVFPYYTAKKHPKKLCSWCHLELCPGPNPNKKEYQQDIKNLIAVLEGKNRLVLKRLKKEMKRASMSRNYERAGKVRDQIRALERVLAHARSFKLPLESSASWQKVQETLLKILKIKKPINRIEAFDVSNIQGQKATGSMVTFVRGISDKNFYRKFRIKIEGKPNDIAMIKEILSRRFSHPEWPLPDLILIDGGKAQLKAAQSVISNQRLKIPVIALAKRKNELFIEKRRRPILLKAFPREIFNLVLQLRDEAHRFALKYHKKLRRKSLIK